MKTQRKTGVDKFSAKDWSDIYDALVDTAEKHHSGEKAERFSALARKILQEVM